MEYFIFLLQKLLRWECNSSGIIMKLGVKCRARVLARHIQSVDFGFVVTERIESLLVYKV